MAGNPELLKRLMEAQFDRDHCEPEERKACSDKLASVMEEVRAIAPDIGDLELLAALEDRYRSYVAERIKTPKKVGRTD